MWPAGHPSSLRRWCRPAVDDRLIVSRGVGDLFIIALAHHDLIGDGDVGGVAGVTGLLDVVIGLAVDDLLALIANGMVGGQVLVDGCTCSVCVTASWWTVL